MNSAPARDALDDKANRLFSGKVVRKDLVRKVKTGANVPVFARFRESGRRQAAPAAIYRVAHFNYGIVVTGDTVGRLDTLVSTEPLHALPAALRQLRSVPGHKPRRRTRRLRPRACR